MRNCLIWWRNGTNIRMKVKRLKKFAHSGALSGYVGYVPRKYWQSCNVVIKDRQHF